VSEFDDEGGLLGSVVAAPVLQVGLARVAERPGAAVVLSAAAAGRLQPGNTQVRPQASPWDLSAGQQVDEQVGLPLVGAALGRRRRSLG
jgi:hypothetical protein